MQTCMNDLEQLKNRLDRERLYFENLQEKLTNLREAREALTILRYEHEEKKRAELDRRRTLMMKKIADLRQFKHDQLFQRTSLDQQ